MATVAERQHRRVQQNRFLRLLDNRRVLVFLFMLPAAGLLLLFLTYPLGPRRLARLHRHADRPLGLLHRLGELRVAVRTTGCSGPRSSSPSSTPCFATIGKFALGLWLALLLNHHLPFKAFIRSIILVPWIVPTVLSAIAFWWIYDPQFSIISYSLHEIGLIDRYIDFLGVPNNARASLIVANIWRGIPFVAICLLAGLQTISPSLYEAAMIDGANAWQRFWHVTLPMLMPILAVVLTFSVLFTFTDFQLVYAITRGGPVNSTHLMATLAFQRAIPGGQLGEGAAIAVAMIPFLVFATCFSYFALARRKWQQGEGND